MKDYIIKHSLNLIQTYDPNIDEVTLAEIEYGLVGLYLTITKVIIIILLAYFLNIMLEVIIFMIIFNVIRTFSFGLHATKTWICLVTSTIVFILVPYLCVYTSLPSIIKWVISMITVCFIFKNSPADTYKRPIVNPIRRRAYKLFSTTIACIFGILALYSQNNFISNCFIYAPIIECFLISPMVYKFFHLPYDNYKTYLEGVKA